MPLINDFPVREDDRTMSYLRRRTLRVQRRSKRQAPPEVDNGIGSDENGGLSSRDEGESSHKGDEAKSTGSGRVTSAPSTTLALPFKPSSTLITSSTATRPRHELSPTPTPTGTSKSDISPIPEAANTGPAVNTRPHTTLSHGTTIALQVIGIGAGVAILLGICFLFYRRLKRKQAENSTATPQTSRSLWGNSKKRFWGGSPSNSSKTAPPMTPSPFGIVNGNNAVNRQERLGLVRTSLLGEKELNGGLMKSRTIMNFGNGVGVPRKVFLKKNGEGKLVMTRDRGKVVGLGLDLRANAVFDGKERVDVEASGQWENPVTVARASLSTRDVVGGGLLQQPVGNVSRGIGVLGMDQVDGSERVVLDEEISKNQSQRSSVWRDRAKERESKLSLAKWRDPVSWVKDQVDRRNGGMQRLPD